MYLYNSLPVHKALYTLLSSFKFCFLFCRQQNKANHCRIKTKQERGQMKYFLVDNLTFDSLYELINHYKTNRLRSQNFEMTLKEPVPSHLGKPWALLVIPTHCSVKPVITTDCSQFVLFLSCYFGCCSPAYSCWVQTLSFVVSVHVDHA